jgi:hypothetical protein
VLGLFSNVVGVCYCDSVLIDTHKSVLPKERTQCSIRALLSGNMTGRLSETRFALVFFTLTLFVSVYGIIEMQSIYHSSYIIYASQLSEKPNYYFVLKYADAPLLEAMSSHDYVNIGSPEETQVDELITALGTSYFEYDGTYYGAGFGFETKYPPPIPFLLILAGSIISASSIVVIASLKTVTQIRNRYRKTN